MKKLLLCSLVLLAVFVGCKKENGKDNNDPDPQTTRYPVRFNVSNFTQTSGGFDERDHSSARDAQDTLRDYIQHLYYLVTGPDGFYRRIDQKAADSSFGIILDTLPPARYTVLLVGSRDSMRIGPAFLGYGDEIVFFDLPGTDVFFKKAILNVTGEVNQEISMNRIVAKVKLIIKDAIPVDVKLITISPQRSPAPFPGEVGGLVAGIDVATGEFTFGTRYEGMYSYYPLAVDSLTGMTNVSTEFYLLTAGPQMISLLLGCLNIDNQTMTELLIQNINIDVNKKTVLTGNLFDEITPDNKGINAAINNPEWSSDSILVEY